MKRTWRFVNEYNLSADDKHNYWRCRMAANWKIIPARAGMVTKLYGISCCDPGMAWIHPVYVQP